MDIKDKNGKVIYTTAGANLSSADLTGADLTHADLSRANLTGANLSNANLTYANLAFANLTHANLTHANLSNANLSYAILTGATLTNADLYHANLTYEQIASANLSEIKADLLSVLNENRNEVPQLRSAIAEGRIEGISYEVSCTCLIGTIANAKGADYEMLSPNAFLPAERWFLAIRKGDTPDKSPIARITLEWVDELLAAR